MPDNKYITLDNLIRFKDNLDVELAKKQDVNVTDAINFPVNLNRTFHISNLTNDSIGILRTDEYGTVKNLLTFYKGNTVNANDFTVQKDLILNQYLTDGTNYITVANIASKQDVAEAITGTIDQKLDKDNFGWVIADHTYNPSYSYNAGDTVYYVDETGTKRGFLYKAKEDIAAPAGDFDYTKWETITLESLIWYKQDKLTFDTTPTAGSENPVTSDGLCTALARKQGNLTFDATPIENSSNPVTSGGIYSAIQAASTPVPVYMHNITVQRQLNSPTSWDGLYAQFNIYNNSNTPIVNYSDIISLLEIMNKIPDPDNDYTWCKNTLFVTGYYYVGNPGNTNNYYNIALALNANDQDSYDLVVYAIGNRTPVVNTYGDVEVSDEVILISNFNNLGNLNNSNSGE